MTKSEVMRICNMTESQLERHATQVRERVECATVCTNTPQTFVEMTKKKPQPGAVLRSHDGRPVRVWEDWKINDGKPVRILLCNATLAEDGVTWYLHSENYGLKCIITLRTHDACSWRPDGTYVVSKLTVLRLTKTGGGLICEAID